MTKNNFKAGDILENSISEFTKVIKADVEAESYSISGWTNLKTAKESTVASTIVNTYGLEACEAKLAKAKAAPVKAAAKAPAKKAAAKTAPKKVAK